MNSDLMVDGAGLFHKVSHQGDLHQDLGDKLAECLWWLLVLFVLSGRLGIDINTAFSSKMSELESSLSSNLENTNGEAGP